MKVVKIAWSSDRVISTEMGEIGWSYFDKNDKNNLPISSMKSHDLVISDSRNFQFPIASFRVAPRPYLSWRGRHKRCAAQYRVFLPIDRGCVTGSTIKFVNTISTCHFPRYAAIPLFYLRANICYLHKKMSDCVSGLPPHSQWAREMCVTNRAQQQRFSPLLKRVCVSVQRSYHTVSGSFINMILVCPVTLILS